MGKDSYEYNMNIVFNELSCNQIPKNETIAGEWLDSFFDTLFKLSERLHCVTYIETNTRFNEIYFTDNFSFAQWIGKIKDRDYKRKIINSLQVRPLIKTLSSCYHNGIETKGLNHAYENNLLVISYPFSNIWPYKIELIKADINGNGAIIDKKVFVYGISNINNINEIFPFKVFDHHEKKHDQSRPNLNDGESTLYYHIPNDNKKVQKLLDCAYSESDISKGERVHCYDSDKKMYIEFNCHENNKFHGYHISDENRVHAHVKLKIENHPFIPKYK